MCDECSTTARASMRQAAKFDSTSDTVSESSSGDPHRVKPSAVLHEQSDLVLAMQQRIIDLERDLAVMDRQNYSNRADLLLRAMGIVHKLILLGFLMIYTLSTHATARLMQRGCGDTVASFALPVLRNVLGSVFSMLKVHAIAPALRIAASAATAAGIGHSDAAETTTAHTAADSSSDGSAPGVAIEWVRIGVSTYWTVMCTALLGLLLYHKLTGMTLHRQLGQNLDPRVDPQ